MKHTHIDVKWFLSFAGTKEFAELFTEEDGTPTTSGEARLYLVEELSKGILFINSDENCELFTAQYGCLCQEVKSV